MKIKLLRDWSNYPKGRELTIANMEGERLVRGGVATQVGTSSHSPVAMKAEVAKEAEPLVKPAKTHGKRSKAFNANTES